MRIHSQRERDEAVKKLPDPVYDFLVGPTLTTIYAGIQKKHVLDLRQLALLADITNLTLTGLEAESALETNLHQAMHELSNQGARELVADINDRVFKEAKRRLQENVLEVSALSEARKQPTLSPEQEAERAEEARLNDLDDDDPEIIALRKQEEAADRAERENADRELAAALEIAENEPPLKSAAEEEVDENLEDDEATKEEPEKASIVEEKLGISTESVKSQSTDEKSATSELTTENSKEESGSTQTTLAASSIQKRPYKEGVDPYREPIG